MVRVSIPVRFLALVHIPALLSLGGLTEGVASAQNPPTIRSSSSLVLVPVSAVDKSGHFVSGLGAHDFQILVDGRRIEIKSFDAISESPSRSSANLSPGGPLPPNTFRNISEFSASQPNLVVLLIDYLNTRLMDRMG